MKKLTALFLALLTIASLSLAVSAHINGDNWGDIPKYTGNIVFDGKKDAIYDMGVIVNINNRTDGLTGGATGVAYMVWGDNKLYVFVDVIDPEIVKLDLVNRKVHQNEGIEFTLDYSNDAKNRLKCSVTYEDQKVTTGDTTPAGMFNAKCTTTSKGYAVELICDLATQTIQPSVAGAKYGINIIINDMTGTDTRGIIRSVHKNNPKENEAKKFDYITLSGDEVVIAAAPVKTEAPAAQTKAPATADGFTLAVIAMISAAGVAVSKKRK